MAGNLVTVATFDRAAEAHLAHGALKAAGIRAELAQEDTSDVLGLAATAATGIKLVVLEEDEARAAKVLDETFEDKPITEEELAAQAQAEAAEDPDDAAGTPRTVVNDPVADLAAREKETVFALRCACLGWLFPPVGLPFALLMILQAASGPGTLSHNGRGNLYTATAIVFAPVFLGVVGGVIVALLITAGLL